MNELVPIQHTDKLLHNYDYVAIASIWNTYKFTTQLRVAAACFEYLRKGC